MPGFHYAHFDGLWLRFPTAEAADRFRAAYPDQVALSSQAPGTRGYWGLPYIGEREDLALIVQLGGHRLYPVIDKLESTRIS